MNTPHPSSPSVIRRPHLGLIPAIHERALERRQELDAQQRTYREADTRREMPRPRPRCPG